jgi:hypothetical protein
MRCDFFLSFFPKVSSLSRPKLSQGHEEAVRFLVSAGADKNVLGPDGMTPLQAAEKDSIKKILSAPAPAGRPAPPPRR